MTPLLLPFVVVGCAASLPSVTGFVVVPGQGKDMAAFQQDDLVCKRDALQQTGYDGSAPALPEVSTASPPPDPIAGSHAEQAAAASTAASPTSAGPVVDPVEYLQCMASRGNTVQPGAPPGGAYPVQDLAGGSAYPAVDAFWAGYPVGYPFDYSGGAVFVGLNPVWGRDHLGHGFRGHDPFFRGDAGHGGFGHGHGGHGGGGHR